MSKILCGSFSSFVLRQGRKRQTVISLFLYICSPGSLDSEDSWQTFFSPLLKYHVSFLYSLLNAMHSAIHDTLFLILVRYFSLHRFLLFSCLHRHFSIHPSSSGSRNVLILIPSQMWHAVIKWFNYFPKFMTIYPQVFGFLDKRYSMILIFWACFSTDYAGQW